MITIPLMGKNSDQKETEIMKQYRLLPLLLLLLTLTICIVVVNAVPAVLQSDLQQLDKEPKTAEITPSVPPQIYVKGTAPGSIKLTWDTTDKNVVLRYTTDFNEPAQSSSLAKNGEIKLTYTDTGIPDVTQCTVRCALFNGRNRVSQCYTFTYISAPKGIFSHPVVSIVSEPDNFYGYEKGILVGGKLADEAAAYGNPTGWVAGYNDANYFRHGSEWERPSHISMYSATGELLLGQNCGVRVSGAYGRSASVKSLKIFARREYTPDAGVFNFSFWTDAFRSATSGTPVTWSDNVILRQNASAMRNEFALLMLEGTEMNRPQHQPVIELINGQYQSLLSMMEDFDPDYIEQHYGFTEDQISMISGQTHECFLMPGWYNDDGPENVYQEFVQILENAQHTNMSIQSHYDALCEKVDMHNYIQTLAWRMYCGDTDFNEQNNQRAWRYIAEGYNPDRDDATDGRWRFFLKDFDISFGNNGSRYVTYNDPYYYVDTFSYFVEYPYFYHPCKENREFADLLHNYMLTLAQDVFVPERYNEVLDYLSVNLLGWRSISTKSTKSIVDGIRDFLEIRPETIKEYTEAHAGASVTNFKLSWTGEGDVKINWFAYQNGATREYLQKSLLDYQPIPAKGYKVGGVDLKNCRITEKGYIEITGMNPTVTVNFVKDETIPEAKGGIVINEVKFRTTNLDWVELYNSSDEMIFLAKWSLGKDAEAERAYTLNNVVLKPGQHALITLYDPEVTTTIHGLRAPMRITTGDTIRLFDREGNVIDEVTLNTPQKTVHLGRYPDGGDWIQMSNAEATPGAANTMIQNNPYFTGVGFPSMLFIDQQEYQGEFTYRKDGVLYANVSQVAKQLKSVSNTLYNAVKDRKEDIPLADLAAILEKAGCTTRVLEEMGCLVINIE